MSDQERQVVDVNGMRYRLGRRLGQGGQGAVFEVEGGRLAAKLVFDRSASRRERLRNQLIHVKRLALGDLEIARPLEMLRMPHVGYLMELLTGMVPLKQLTHLPRKDLSLSQWYISGGGLRRRLRLLGRAADLLSQLHGKGLVYADPSPHNIFVSANPDGHELRLIDADNLHYQSAPLATGIYTPGYGAPEVVRGQRGVDTLTDAHAFAVIVFQTLAQVHPLLGDAISDGEPEQEEAALQGGLPWIDHPEDGRNRSSRGFPRDIVLSPRLKE
ncbi:MAG TPA: serine/threonine-protein kinase, partial [Archangium sp.]|nr:serine/threonine-protein kinase [Archangium sp.]